MLNTDLHNKTVKKANKMTLEQFLRNNQCVASLALLLLLLTSALRVQGYRRRR